MNYFIDKLNREILEKFNVCLNTYAKANIHTQSACMMICLHTQSTKNESFCVPYEIRQMIIHYLLMLHDAGVSRLITLLQRERLAQPQQNIQ